MSLDLVVADALGTARRERDAAVAILKRFVERIGEPWPRRLADELLDARALLKELVPPATEQLIRSLLPYAESMAEDLTEEAEMLAGDKFLAEESKRNVREAAAKAWLAVEAAHAFLGTATRKSVLAGAPPDGLEMDRNPSDVDR